MSIDIGQNLNNLMKEAQKMQQRMQEAQEQLTQLVVTGEAGGGMLKVKMNGRHDLVAAKINPALLQEDAEMLEALIVAAVNDAVRKIEKASAEHIKKLTAGFNLPKDFLEGGEGDKDV